MDKLEDKKEEIVYYKQRETEYGSEEEKANNFKEYLEQLGLRIEDEDFEMWRFAFDNALNWDAVKSKFENLSNNIGHVSTKNQIPLKSVSNLPYDPVVLSNCVIVVEMLTEVAKIEFMQDKWKEVFQKIIFDKCTAGIRSNGDKNFHEVINRLIETDLFGQWEKDLLFGHIKIILKVKDGKPFPKFWKIDINKTNELEIIYESKETQEKKIQETKNDTTSETLDSFVTKFLANNQNEEPKFKKKLLEQLQSCYINSLNDLITLPPKVWTDSLEKPMGRLFDPFKREIDKYKKQKSKKGSEKRSAAEELADLHKVRRFLYHEADKTDELKKMGYLNSDALNKGFTEQKNDKHFDGGPILMQIQYCLEQFDKPAIELVKPSHGMILWGPPGTGKTKLCEVICKKAGIELVVEPLSSSELNRSKVGETEQLLMSLFARAERLPHLLCCIAIDEVDALTPKRNEKTGEHKVDVLCLLLSLIGGIKDVSNVFVIASTNRLNKMDEAFCRRLQTKFFVGRLGPQKRLEILSKIKEANINNKKIDFPSSLHRLAQQLTINFSGAAIESFRSRLISYLYNKEEVSIDKETLSIHKEFVSIHKETLCDIANQVARDFQILLGSYTIPTLISTTTTVELNLRPGSKYEKGKIIDSRINYTGPKYEKGIISESGIKYTGRILIDMSDDDKCLIQVEYEDKSNKKRVQEQSKIIDFKKGVKQPQQPHEVIPILLKTGIKERVDFVQMFDVSMLLNNAAFDDNTIMETVLEKKGEWEQYPTAMAIFDVDALVGINENLSDSGMGQSSSKSITNNRLWHQVVIQTANSKLEDPNEKNKLLSEKKFLETQLLNKPAINNGKAQTKEELVEEQNRINTSFEEMDDKILNSHRWVVVITKNSFISTQFKVLTSFPLTSEEIEKQKEESKVITCADCDFPFIKCKNGLGDCNYHDGPLVDKRMKKTDMMAYDKNGLLEMIIGSRDISIGSKNTSTALKDWTADLQNYVYLCCGQQHLSQGCKRGYHIEHQKDSRKDYKKYGVTHTV